MEKIHIASLSYSKDSCGLVIGMLEAGMPIDEIVSIDTTAEYPEMYKHIEKFDKFLKEKYNMVVTKLAFENTFNFYMLDYEKTKGKSKGSKGYGWCGGLCRWGTTLKKQIFNKYVKEKYGNNIIEYQGIAADEPARFEKNQEKKWEIKYPMVDWGMEEKDALKLCYDLGFDWGGLYKYLDRVSCWCCRNKNLKELKNIYRYMPDTWNKLKELEKSIGEPYRKTYSLDDLERRFKREISNEYEQLSFLEV
jgi:3'-phosphoadenosine 5'-phosphosulfate sulfotransferase (PAPS reductase)/FAD synthetase